MNKNMIIVIVLAVLIVISAVQAVQLSGLKEKISSGEISGGSVSQRVATGQGKNPASLENLPSMVGGC